MVALVLFGCATVESGPYWGDALAPDGPCYAFDLTDGVVAGDNTELHAAFACLNRQGTVQPLSRVDVALDGATRGGNVGGTAVTLVQAWAGRESSSFAALLDDALALLDEREAVLGAVGLLLEWTYAAPTGELGTGVSINSGAALADGVLLPAYAAMAGAAGVVMDEGLVALPPLAEALRSEALVRLAWSAALAPEAPDDDLRALAQAWPDVLAAVLDAADQGANDREPGPTGNSLRDLAGVLVGGATLAELVQVARPLLEDDLARDALVRWVEDEAEAGRWAGLVEGVAYLASVDRRGEPLSGGEDSALEALVRLFHDANRPVECTVDLLVTDIHIDLGNLAVALLQAIAALDPDTATDGVGVLGSALGYPLTDSVLGLLADSAVCPVLDAEFVEDLQAVDRLGDAGAGPVLRSLIGLLGAVDEHIGTLADVATALHEAALVDPLEELVYDLEGLPATDLVLAAVPALLDPDLRVAEGFPAAVRPVDADLILDVVLAVGEADTWATVQPVAAELLGSDDTWTALAHSVRLLEREGTATRELLPELHTRLQGDPTLARMAALAALVEDPAVARPALELAESAALRQALTTTELADPGPLPWIAELYRGGTLDQLWDTLALFRPLLGGSDA